MKVVIIVGATLSLLAVPSFAAKKTVTLPDLIRLCKKECPDAKDLKATMECVETQEHAGGPASKAFKKTKCYITHEKFEDKYNEMAGLPKENESGEKTENN